MCQHVQHGPEVERSLATEAQRKQRMGSKIGRTKSWTILKTCCLVVSRKHLIGVTQESNQGTATRKTKSCGFRPMSEKGQMIVILRDLCQFQADQDHIVQ